MPEDPGNLRTQIVLQCRAVAHMARAIAEVHDARAKIMDARCGEELNDYTGRCTAALMETLGDILNGMDAVTAEDDWINPVIDRARELWPQEETNA